MYICKVLITITTKTMILATVPAKYSITQAIIFPKPSQIDGADGLDGEITLYVPKSLIKEIAPALIELIKGKIK